MDSPWLFFLRREVTTSLIFKFRSLPSKKRLHTKKHAKACRTCNKTLITFIMQHASRLAACSFINTCNVQNAYNKACKHSLQNIQRTCMPLHQNRSCKQHATYIKKYLRNVYAVIPGIRHANNMHYKICKGRIVLLYTCNEIHAIIIHYKIWKDHLFCYICNQTSTNMQTCITTYPNYTCNRNSSNMQAFIKNIQRASMLLCMQNVIQQHANMHYSTCKECIYHYTCNRNSSNMQTCILKYAKDVIHYRYTCNKTCEHALKV